MPPTKMTYADSSILVSVYAFEDAAQEAQKLLSSLSHPVPLNHFLLLEIRNAIRRKVPTGKATKAQVKQMLNGLEKSIAEIPMRRTTEEYLLAVQKHGK